jgi:peptidoglycan/xylan/chitin deacetylase (PgdA/CDA1 family)
VSTAVVVSLDFELRWGLSDILGLDAERYRTNIEGVEEVVPRLLEVFTSRGVHATWATVGAVACESWDEWRARAPAPPSYDDASLRWTDAYRQIDPRGRLHFAPRLVDAIRRAPGQELGSHTFSHVYLREPGFSREDAIADADAMVALFRERWGGIPRSFVFPRNQVAHTDVLRSRGIHSWRDNPETFYWRSTAAAEQSRLARALRLADSMLPLGRRAAPLRAQRASYFVRVGLPGALWQAHRARIRNEARALRPGDVLHLWWHPHNLGDAPRRKAERIAELLDVVREACGPDTTFASMADVAASAA